MTIDDLNEEIVRGLSNDDVRVSSWLKLAFVAPAETQRNVTSDSGFTSLIQDPRLGLG